MQHEARSRQDGVWASRKPAMRPRALTTPWLLEDVRDALASQGERRSPEKDRRRQLRMLFGV